MAILARKTLFDSFIKIEITYTNLFSRLYNVHRQCDWTHFPSNLLNWSNYFEHVCFWNVCTSARNNVLHHTVYILFIYYIEIRSVNISKISKYINVGCSFWVQILRMYKRQWRHFLFGLIKASFDLYTSWVIRRCHLQFGRANECIRRLKRFYIESNRFEDINGCTHLLRYFFANKIKKFHPEIFFFSFLFFLWVHTIIAELFVYF